MGFIEKKINEFLREPRLLIYEAEITKYFLENDSYGIGFYSPHFLSGLWRLVVFVAIITLIIWFSIKLLSFPLRSFFIIPILYFACFQIFQYIKLYRSGNEKIDEILNGSRTEYSRYATYLGLFFHIILIIILSIFLIYPDFSINYLSNFLFNEGDKILLSSYVFLYEVACSLFLFTPSEAPVIFYKSPMLTSFEFIVIAFILAALGKGFGAFLFCITINYYDRVFKISKFKSKLIKFIQLKSIISPNIDNLIRKYGFIAYLFFQSVPFMPMRSSIYFYSIFSQNSMRVALGAAVGTVFRNAIMLFIIMSGWYLLRLHV